MSTVRELLKTSSGRAFLRTAIAHGQRRAAAMMVEAVDQIKLSSLRGEDGEVFDQMLNVLEAGAADGTPDIPPADVPVLDSLSSNPHVLYRLRGL